MSTTDAPLHIGTLERAGLRDEEPIDPEVAVFAAAIQSAFANFADLPTADFPRRRAIAEQVRSRWRAGGPSMARREDHVLATSAGEIRVRLFMPQVASPPAVWPALVYNHGGGFTSFSLDTHDRLMREYAAGAQAAVVGVDYSLSPEAKFPRALDEVVATLDHLFAHGAVLGVDPQRLAIGGDSAGANLALAACLTLRDRAVGDRCPARPAVRGMLLNYGFFDRDFTTPSHRRHGGADKLLSTEELMGYLDNYLGGTDRWDDARALPILADLHDLPPSFHVIAECDPLADGNRAMAARLAAAGTTVTSVVYRGATHSFLEAVSISSLARRALDEASAWLRDVLEAGDAHG